MINQLLKAEVKNFIKEHLNDDPALLSLKVREVEGTDIKLIAEQIICHQKAASKLPEWGGNTEIIFPGPIAVEQASSAITADYKASLFKGKLAIDLTGGLGIDSLAFAKNFEKVIYVEADKVKAEAARHNFRVLEALNVEVVNSSAEEFLSVNSLIAELIYIDPDRRPGAGRVFSLEKSTPDVVDLKTKLLSVSKTILIKASPMLDITATTQLLPEISEVHVVAVSNECKEVLFIMSKNKGSSIIAASYSSGRWNCTEGHVPVDKTTTSYPQNYIYEPGAAILKAGIQDSVGNQHGLAKLHHNTNLYTSTQQIPDFPGRSFKLLKVIPVNKKAVKTELPHMKGNLSTRNFPEHVNRLKEKLKLKDGGEYYLFACRLSDLSYKLLITTKA